MREVAYLSLIFTGDFSKINDGSRKITVGFEPAKFPFEYLENATFPD